jgi:hypothetical protein
MPPDEPQPVTKPATDEPDYYFEHGLLVYTAAFHLNRGSCCGSGCRHCPYEPKHVEGNQVVQPAYRRAPSYESP